MCSVIITNKCSSGGLLQYYGPIWRLQLLFSPVNIKHMEMRDDALTSNIWKCVKHTQTNIKHTEKGYDVLN